MASQGDEQPPSSSYMDMLVSDDKCGSLTALETIRDAGSDPHSPHTAAVVRPPVSAAGSREVAFRVSTPERLRRRSEQLSSEIRTMMDRHDARAGREREVQRRTSKTTWGESSRGAARRADNSSASASRGPASGQSAPLPDLRQAFEESRRTHLTEAQQHRTYFPSSSKPTAYSPKDPGTFSYRFQAAGPSILDRQ